jgi:hypothetical protein
MNRKRSRGSVELAETQQQEAIQTGVRKSNLDDILRAVAVGTPSKRERKKTRSVLTIRAKGNK